MIISTIKDSYVDQNTPSTNYGNAISIKVQGRASYNLRSYIEFDISSIPSMVSEAKLWLYCYYVSDITRTHYIDRVTSSWNESTITWNSGQPSITNTNRASRSASVSDDDQWVSWDITNLLNDETGSTLGVRLSDGSETGSLTTQFSFTSSDDTSNHPYIEINTYYYVKTTGNDSLDGASWANAWKTINKAATTVVDGATVHIGFGTYDAEPAANKIAPQNVGTLGIYYLPETATTGGGTGTVSVEQNA